jgi:hypothetical protein
MREVGGAGEQPRYGGPAIGLLYEAIGYIAFGPIYERFDSSVPEVVLKVLFHFE